MDTHHRWMQAVVPATMAGCLRCLRPPGSMRRGLPAGIQILGPAQTDHALLQIGHATTRPAVYARVRSPLLAAEHR